MGYKHIVQKWKNGIFVKENSTSTTYYSMGAYLDGDDDVDEVDVDTIGELYRLWQDAKAGDRACGENGWKYHFYKHTIEENKKPDGKTEYIDYVTEGKVYRRGNKVFFKAITG